MRVPRTLVFMDEDQNTLVAKPDPYPRGQPAVILTMQGVDGFSGDFRMELDDAHHLLTIFKELLNDA